MPRGAELRMEDILLASRQTSEKQRKNTMREAARSARCEKAV